MKTQSLELFQFTQPENIIGNSLYRVKTRNNDAGEQVGITLTLESRKVVAKALGEKVKSSKVTDALLLASDAVKSAAVQEIVKMAASPDWTGGAARITRNKAGGRRATFSFVTADRDPHKVTPEALAKALANMSEDEQVAIMEKAEALKAEASATNV